MDKKALKEEYKQRKIIGGIYKITNMRSGMFLFNFTPDIEARQNSFAFMAFAGTCFDNRVRKDWEEFGNQIFTFEVLETLEKKKDQTHDQFLADLQSLAELWSEKLDLSKKY
jgi:hypothetical protein